MTKNAGEKREREKALVSEMIALCCRKRHGVKDGLCLECAGNEKREKTIGGL